MLYYGDNAIYRYLEEQGLRERYFWVSGSMWTLLYSDGEGSPAVLCFVSQVESRAELFGRSTPEEARAFQRFSILARQARLPLISLRFVKDEYACREFCFREYQAGELARVITSEELLDRLRGYGLELRGDAAGKEVNSAPSSSFHLWQRKHMGSGVIASDLDLMRVDDGRIDTIYELKRSFKALEEWQPYEADRVNYRLGLALARRAGTEYRIVYNRRETHPTKFDDVSRLSIFALDEGWPRTI